MIKIKFNFNNVPRFILALALYTLSLYVMIYAINNQNVAYGVLALLICTILPKNINSKEE